MRASARRRWSLLLALVSAILLAGAFAGDAGVQTWIAQHQLPSVQAAMRNVSRWGDWPSHVVVGLIGVALAYFLDRPRWLAIFAAMVLACALAGTANCAIKIVAGRARPAVTADPGWHGPRLSSKYHSFPSGHTAASTAFFAVLLFARPRIGTPLLAIPILIGFSRVSTGAHHLSDVVFAAILGALCGWLVWRWVWSTRWPERAQAAGVTC